MLSTRHVSASYEALICGNIQFHIKKTKQSEWYILQNEYVKNSFTATN
jgi:hypothetical protein